MTDTLTDAEFEQFRSIIYSESGITFSETNRSILESRIKELIREKSVASVNDYYKLVTTNSDEMKYMLDAVTTNLTRFFRNQAHFDALEHFVIPNILKEKEKVGNTKIRVWSAGCSTGEEPYTIAMLLKSILPAPYTFAITASDLSLKSLMTAKLGYYAASKVTGIPDSYLAKYLTKSTDGYQMNKEIMDTIHFDYHNLKHAITERNFDIVFCRNVLIYFDEPAQRAVINNFYEAMAPHSYLFIGHSESLFGMDTKFEFVKTEQTTLYQKNEP
ncbi:MAG: protein-glutamate O-methyltransferase CheR [Treponema sp.]|nr:protein-glutamate O-methyltransferase CheR [Treponema sp.]